MPGKRAGRHFSQFSRFERGLIIGIKTAGWLTRHVAGQVDRSESAVINCWEQWTREGTHVRKTGSGATRKTTRREDRRIVRKALADPTVTRSTIRADVGVAIVPRKISRHLAEANLKSKRPFRALPLTPEHRKLRLQWCQAKSMWNVTDWQKVVFSDESRFVLGTDDNRVRVWRRPEPFLNGLPGAISQQDNARLHTARVDQDLLRHFYTLPWLARSPDLSPVEHVWDQLKQQMPLCHSVHDLELAVQDLWAHLPQDNIRNEKDSNHGSIPITIDCNVVAFIVYEEGFHQPIKRTKHSPRLIEDEAFNDCDIMKSLIDYENGQEEPDSLRVDKNTQRDPAFQQIGKAFSSNRYQLRNGYKITKRASIMYNCLSGHLQATDHPFLRRKNLSLTLRCKK
ncbi:transposable element Tc1 transposase [Trichonephila clavipes]|nr:transposable element Tc1 transposase [Trichonephila clavipes]